MGKRYLIDTCAAIKYLNATLPDSSLVFMDNIVDSDCIISFITKIELLAKKQIGPEDIIVIRKFLQNSQITYIDDIIIDQAIIIRRSTKVKLPDAIIAATAMVKNLILVSDNDEDFKKVIPLGLDYFNPKSII